MENDPTPLLLALTDLVADLAVETADLIEHSTHNLHGKAVGESRKRAAKLQDKQNAVRALLGQYQPGKV
jgi:hypothetical protein